MEIMNFSEAELYFDISSKFNSEKEFTEDLCGKLHQVIKESYGYNVESIQINQKFDYRKYGHYNIIPDITVVTDRENFIIECKNPRHIKVENINAISQLMSYQMLLENFGKKYIYVIATSVFEMYLPQFLIRYNLNFDLLLNNTMTTAYLKRDEL